MLFSVLIWALSAIVTKETNDEAIEDQTKMYVAALLSISCFLLLLRMILIIVRQIKQPLGQENFKIEVIAGGRTSTTYGSSFLI